MVIPSRMRQQELFGPRGCSQTTSCWLGSFVPRRAHEWRFWGSERLEILLPCWPLSKTNSRAVHVAHGIHTLAHLETAVPSARPFRAELVVPRCPLTPIHQGATVRYHQLSTNYTYHGVEPAIHPTPFRPHPFLTRHIHPLLPHQVSRVLHRRSRRGLLRLRDRNQTPEGSGSRNYPSPKPSFKGFLLVEDTVGGRPLRTQQCPCGSRTRARNCEASTPSRGSDTQTPLSAGLESSSGLCSPSGSRQVGPVSVRSGRPQRPAPLALNSQYATLDMPQFLNWAKCKSHADVPPCCFH